MPYEVGGRSNQKQRTREALVMAARAQVQAGHSPTVEEAAAAAGISRTTAYRYFPNQRSLLAAAHPETVASSMLVTEPASTDPAERLDEVVGTFIKLIVDTEPQQRTMLKLSLEPASGERLPLRQGRAIAWITEALEPLQGQLSDSQIHDLVLAIRSATGIESLVWLTDIGGLSREKAADLMLWTSRCLLQAAITGSPPGEPQPSR